MRASNSSLLLSRLTAEVSGLKDRLLREGETDSV